MIDRIDDFIDEHSKEILFDIKTIARPSISQAQKLIHSPITISSPTVSQKLATIKMELMNK